MATFNQLVFKHLFSAVLAFMLLLPSFESFAQPEGKLRGMQHKRQLNEFIVVLTSDVTDSLEYIGQHLAQAHQGQYLGKYESINAVYLNIPENKVQKLSTQPEVLYVEANIIGEIASVDWGLDRLNQRALPLDGVGTHDMSGAGQTIYMVDTGINYDHEIFNGRASYFWSQFAFTQGIDCNGHGTHTAGIVAQTIPYADIKSVRVLNCSGSGSNSTIIGGIDYIASYGVPNSVVYIGLGGGASSTLDSAVQRLIDAGFHVVIAAGNGSEDAINVSPARVADAITVASMGINDNTSFFSNYGAVVDMMAPGENILSANFEGLPLNNSYQLMTGTSQSAAYAAAVLAGYVAEGGGVNDFFGSATFINGLLIPYLQPVYIPPPTPEATSNVSISTTTSIDGSFTVSWNTVTGVTYYSIAEQYNSGTWSSYEWVGLNKSKAYNSKVDGNYKYRVLACNEYSSPECSDYATSGIVTVDTPPPPPPLPTSIDSIDVKNLDLNTGSYTVEWFTSGEAAIHYELIEEIDGVSGSTQTITGTTIKVFSNKAAGKYRYKVRSYDGSTYSAEIVSATVTISDVATSTLNNTTASPTSAAANFEVGVTAGQFRVNESGAATYSVPLNLPAGVAGVKPQVSLNYSSQGSDGVMGRGWSVGAGGSISRCPMSMFHNNGEISSVENDENDRFCLDGQQLFSTGGTYGADGTTYYTVMESFSIITSHGNASESGPEYFTVETKSGDTFYYGDCDTFCGVDGSDAFVEPNNSPTPGNTVAKFWALKQVEDVVGNTIVYQYEEDPSEGSHYLSEIEYGANKNVVVSKHFNKIKFNYSANPKMKAGYSVGSTILMDKLLDDITITINDDTHRVYKLDYSSTDIIEELNYLESITECIATNDCLPSLTFSWERPAEVVTSMETTTRCEPDTGGGEFCFTYESPNTTNYQPFKSTPVAKGNDSSGRKHSRMFDINADGYSDIIYESNDWRVKYGPDFNTGQRLTSIGASDSDRNYALNIDYDGDGKQDLLVADSKTDNWHVLSYTPAYGTTNMCWFGSCFDVPKQPTFEEVDLGLIAHGFEGEAQVMDVDGDGLQDIVYVFGNELKVYQNGHNGVRGDFSSGETILNLNASSTYRFSEALVKSTPGMNNTAIIDINGDGRSDFLAKVTKTNSWWVCEINGVEDPSIPTQGVCQDREIGGDWVQRIAEFTSWDLFVSDGDSASPTYVSRRGISYNTDDLRVTDLNGDGLTDAVYRLDGNDTWYYSLSDGMEFGDAHQTSHTSPDGEAHEVFFMDLNGDGRADILKPSSKTNWNILLSRPYGTSDSVDWDYRGDLSRNDDDSILFGDADGDGKMDILTTKDSNGWDVRYNSRQGIVDNVITDIDNGWGVTTTVTYDTLMNDSIYLFSDYIDSPIDTIAPIGAMAVVSRVESDSNYSNRVAVGYQYAGMLMHTKGLGSLGFRELITTDEQSDVQTQTKYFQGYPYIGIPESTIQMWVNGATEIELSNSVNTPQQKVTAGYGGLYPYISQSVEYKYQVGWNGPNPETGSDDTQHFINKTISNNTFDTWGNLTVMKNRLYDEVGNIKHTTRTSNIYAGEGGGAAKGRLSSTTVTKALSNPTANCAGISNICRTSSYVYFDDGMLKSSTVNGLTTEYAYDDFGHKTTVKTIGGRGDGGADVNVSITSLYSPDGRFLSSTNHPAKGTTNYTYIDFAGVTQASSSIGKIKKTSRIDENDISASSYFNLWGKKTAVETSLVPPVYTNTRYCSNCTATSKYYIDSVQEGSPTKRVIFDKFGRELTTQIDQFKSGYVYNFKDYDSHGRISREYLPQSSGTRATGSSNYTEFSYDKFSRPITVEMPINGNADYVTPRTIYAGLTTTKLDAKGNTLTETRNVLGQLESVQDAIGGVLSYTYDVFGKLLTVTKADGIDSIVQVTNKYNAFGHKTETDDVDKGEWNYRYNDFGQIVWQKNANLDETITSYDNYGRKVRQASNDFTQCWIYGTDASSHEKGKLVSTRYYDDNGSALCTSTAFTQGTEIDYDTLGRAYHTKETINNILDPLNGDYHTYQQFDDTTGKLVKTSYPGLGVTIENQYTSKGYLEKLVNADTGKVYQEITGTNVRGQTTSVTYANGVTEAIGFDSRTGHVTSHNVNGGTVHSLTYSYDSVGNLDNRQHTFGVFSSNSDYKETYDYDDLNRLTDRTVTVGSQTSYSMNESYQYDGFGNITQKGSSKYYKYDAENNHKLQGVYSDESHTGSALYYFNDNYDTNGNILSDGHYDENGEFIEGGRRTLVYSSFDKVTQIMQGSTQTDFMYGMGHKRYYRHDIRTENSEQVDTHTAYLSGLEKIYRTGKGSDLIEYKFYVGNVVITERTNQLSSDDFDEFYLHKDHLGSPLSITNKSGALVQQNVYDPWGKVHQLAVDNNLIGTTNLMPTTRGYTGHEGIEGVDIVHMNGRIYDPTLGRFLQADPHIQAPKNSQSYNRYSYVLNNPLSYTDPSGYFFSGLKKKIKKYWRVAAAIAISIYMPGYLPAAWGSIGAGAATGFVAGGVATGSLKGALVGAFSGAMFGALHHMGAGFGKIVAHGVAGGIGSSLNGGKFGHGFFAAGFTQGISQGGGVFVSGDRIGNAIKAAVIGGTASAISGGKFANGAVTGAFSRLLNDDWMSRANKVFKETEFEDVVDAKVEAGVTSASGSSVSTDGEVVKGSVSQKIKAGVADVSITGACNSDGNCNAGIEVSKGVTIIDENLASARAALSVNTNGQAAATVKGTVASHYVKGSVVVDGGGIINNISTLNSIAEQSFMDSITQKIEEKMQFR